MKDPVPTFSYLVKRLASEYPKLAYLHIIEPGVDGIADADRREGNVNSSNLSAVIGPNFQAVKQLHQRHLAPSPFD